MGKAEEIVRARQRFRNPTRAERRRTRREEKASERARTIQSETENEANRIALLAEIATLIEKALARLTHAEFPNGEIRFIGRLSWKPLRRQAIWPLCLVNVRSWDGRSCGIEMKFLSSTQVYLVSDGSLAVMDTGASRPSEFPAVWRLKDIPDLDLRQIRNALDHFDPGQL